MCVQEVGKFEVNTAREGFLVIPALCLWRFRGCTDGEKVSIGVTRSTWVWVISTMCRTNFGIHTIQIYMVVFEDPIAQAHKFCIKVMWQRGWVMNGRWWRWWGGRLLGFMLEFILTSIRILISLFLWIVGRVNEWRNGLMHSIDVLHQAWLIFEPVEATMTGITK